MRFGLVKNRYLLIHNQNVYLRPPRHHWVYFYTSPPPFVHPFCFVFPSRRTRSEPTVIIDYNNKDRCEHSDLLYLYLRILFRPIKPAPAIQNIYLRVLPLTFVNKKVFALKFHTTTFKTRMNNFE